MSKEKKLTESEINLMIENVKASVAIEGKIPSDEAIEISKDYLRGNISEEEALNHIKENIKKIIGR